MVYIFGLALIFIMVVAFWCIRAIVIAAINALARKRAERQPGLPPPVVMRQPSLSETAEHVFERFISSTMVGVGEPEIITHPPPAAASRRRSSVYSGVVRAHPDCGSDPELPKYSPSATASRPELIIIEDDNMPPPLTPLSTRSNTPTPSEESATPQTPVEEAPGYTTRPATPVLLRATSMTDGPDMVDAAVLSVTASPVAVPHVTFGGDTALPTPPPQARRKNNQRRPGPPPLTGWNSVTPL